MIKSIRIELDKRTKFAPINYKNLSRFDFSKVTARQLLASIDFRDENIYRPGNDKIEIIIGKVKLYIGLPLSFGNSKLSSTIAISSLLPLVTCEKGLSCRGDCYAVDCLHRPNVWNKRIIYTYIVFHCMNEYFDLIRYQFNNLPPRVNSCRLHESGDFPFQEYANEWVNVCKDYPNIDFYYYTKSKCDLSILENLPNVVSNKSMYGKYKNFGTKEYCENLFDMISIDEKYRVHICPCNPEALNPKSESEKICGKTGPGGCNFCNTKVEGKINFPIFLGHGKKYDKKKGKKSKKNKNKKVA